MIIVQQNMYVRRGAEKLHRSRKKAAVNQKLPGKLCISPPRRKSKYNTYWDKFFWGLKNSNIKCCEEKIFYCVIHYIKRKNIW